MTSRKAAVDGIKYLTIPLAKLTLKEFLEMQPEGTFKLTSFKAEFATLVSLKVPSGRGSGEEVKD